MKPDITYLFTSERLGFRPWMHNDLDEFAAMNADPMVMEHFPKPLSRKESAEFLDRLFKHYAAHGYCYFAAEVLENRELIGFTAWRTNPMLRLSHPPQILDGGLKEVPGDKAMPPKARKGAWNSLLKTLSWKR